MSYSKKRIIFIEDVKEINNHLAYCKKRRIYAPNEESWKESKHTRYMVDVGKTRLVLTYYNGSCVASYVFQLDNASVVQKILGSEAYSRLQRMAEWKIPDLTHHSRYLNQDFEEVELFNNPWKVSKCSGILWHPREAEGQAYDNCYGYDLNSSFPLAMLHDMPDTEHLLFKKFVEPGEVGFKLTENAFTGREMLTAVYEGKADYIFPLKPSPFKHFVEYYYNIKENNKNKHKREVAKQVLNYAIGYIRRKNPFVHCAIITQSNNYIMSFIDENTLYCNTDSIVSKVKRPDIEENLGDNIGQWKIEHEGTFKLANNGYQWNDDLPVIRGVAKEWYKRAFPNGFNILTDKIPGLEYNVYKFDFFKMEVLLNECYEIRNLEEICKEFEKENYLF